jgi:hypothetical protein
MRGVGAAGSGAAWMVRRSVSGLAVRPSASSKRAPGSPPRAKAIAAKTVARRAVRRAWGATTVGTRSVQVRRAQVGVRQ